MDFYLQYRVYCLQLAVVPVERKNWFGATWNPKLVINLLKKYLTY